MDIGRILTRSFQILWKHKFLSLFGLVMGLTGGTNVGSNSNYRFGDNNGFSFGQGARVDPVVIGLAIVVGVIILIVALVLFFYFRFVARGALVTAVRDIEANGTSTLREAWREGHKFYTRLLGLGFLVNVPLALFSILLLVIAFAPLISLIVTATQQGGDLSRFSLASLGITAAIAICFAIICLIVVHFMVHPLYEFAVRAIVLEDLSVMDGLRRGIARAREHVGSVIMIYLALIGARIAWALVAALIAIPFGLVAIIGLATGLRQDLNALIILLLIAAIPLWLVFGAVEGLFQTFESNVWTETYLALQNQDKPVTPAI